MMKNVRIIPAVLVLVLCLCSSLSAEEGLYSLGGKTGWKGLASAQNIAYTKGLEGCDAWMIAEREPDVTAETDVLLTFNNSRFYDETGHYMVVTDPAGNIKAYDHPGDHGNSVQFRGTGGITLKGSPEGLFGRQGLTGSFTLSFWLNPSVIDSGEEILSWHSSRNLPNYSLYQMILASFENNHLRWYFTNVFDTYTDENNSVEITGKSVLVPGTWSCHQLIYHGDTGLLEYLVNGRIEDMQYVTDTGRETGTVYPARLGVVADLNICASYTGYLDDFSIELSAADSSRWQADLFDRYEAEGGQFVTGIFKISDDGAKLKDITVSESVPEQTDTQYFVRWDVQPYGWTDTEPAWHEFSSGESLTALQSGYSIWFQIKGCLYTDGTAAETPVVSGFDIAWEKRELPFAPYNLRAAAGNSSVTLSWKASPTRTAGGNAVGGYVVYYGERPGEYLGTGALEGDSPIYIGNETSVTITGLQNGKLYYFAVCACSGDQPVVTGPLSAEVYARPGSKRK